MAKPSKHASIYSNPLLWIIVVALLLGGFFIGHNFLINNKTADIDSIDTSDKVPQDWKTYTNSKYGFSVMYPPTGKWGELQEDGTLKNIQSTNVVISNDYNEPLETADSVTFNLEAPIPQSPLFYISVLNDITTSEMDTKVYNAHSKTTLEKIFALNVGESLDEQTSKEIGGNWPDLGTYKRLPDINVNDQSFFVIENMHGHGGIDKRLFLRKDNNVFVTGKTYNNDRDLKEFELFYSSFKVAN